MRFDLQLVKWCFAVFADCQFLIHGRAVLVGVLLTCGVAAFADCAMKLPSRPPTKVPHLRAVSGLCYQGWVCNLQLPNPART